MYIYQDLPRGENPLVFNVKPKDFECNPVTVPLDTVVYLQLPSLGTPGTPSRFVWAPKHEILRVLVDTYGKSVPENVQEPINTMLDKVNTIGYKPNADEQIAVTYDRVMRHIEARRK